MQKQHIPTPIYIIKKSYVDGTSRQMIEFVTDDRAFAIETCERYNKAAMCANYDIFFSIETIVGYFK